jgi:hypothetical protein
VTVRYEGADARHTFPEVLSEGEEIGEDRVPPGQIALAFSYDEVFYLQGTPEQVRRLLEAALRLIPPG